jgi:hypothetical protein
MSSVKDKKNKKMKTMKKIESARRECERQSWIISCKWENHGGGTIYVPIDEVAQIRIQDYERKVKYAQKRIKAMKAFREHLKKNPGKAEEIDTVIRKSRYEKGQAQIEQWLKYWEEHQNDNLAEQWTEDERLRELGQDYEREQWRRRRKRLSDKERKEGR